MTRIRRISRALLLPLVLLVATSAVLAEEVEKKWRLSLALGGYNPQQSVESNASNTLFIVNRQAFETGDTQDAILTAQYSDPRDDSSAFGDLDVNNGLLGTFAAQYALTSIFLVEGSIGYQRSDLGDVEVAVQFDGRQPAIPEIDFAFDAFHVKAGEIERVPIQLDGILRFRPRAKFNPYFGAGIGYSVVGFEPSAELNQLSERLDGATGRQCRLTSELDLPPTLDCSGVERDLGGATVEAQDTFEWNLVAGAELTFKRRMSAFLDLRWVDASRQVEVKFNGSSEVGVSVPRLTDFDTSPAAQAVYGGVSIQNGGLMDDGVLWQLPVPTIPINTTGCQNPFSAQCVAYCQTFSSECFANFIASPGSGQTLIDEATGQLYTDVDPGDGDGRTDPGIYYVQGGELSYDGFSLQLGFRYTF